ncbi:MAG: adenylate/guanylate cyclase domain-containing protein [Bacteroidota bacterium]
MAINYNKTQRIVILLNYVIVWIFLFTIFALVRSLGTSEVGAIQTSLRDRVQLTLVLGSITGLLSGIFQIYFEEKLYQRLQFLQAILIKTLLILFLGLVFLIGAFLYFKKEIDPDLKLSTFMSNPTGLSVIIFILLADNLLSFIRKISQMLGEKTFINLIRGKYYRPRKEERIFMFLDLKGSTTIAEKLGFEKYSYFIQECFKDLGVVMDTQAEIYQYVGDEAVLTWKLKEGLKHQNCVNAFFRFKEQLISRSKYYLDKYGVEPTFKAGMHLGPVMVAEVGKYKKEIAYHGDTINTAARIQAKCNDFNSDFIISKQLKEKINKTGMRYYPLGSLKLRGKQETTTLYSMDNKKVVFIN